MLTINEITRTLSALNRHGVEVPKPISTALDDARDLQDAAAAALAAINAETMPDLSTATAATVDRIIDAYVAAGTRDTRAAVARELVAEGERRWLDAGQRLTSTAMVGLAPAFDRLGLEFVGHLEVLDGDARPIPRTGALADAYAATVEIAAELRELAALRDALARESLAPLAHPGVERVTRCHVVPDIGTAQRVVLMLGAAGTWEAPAIAERLSLPGLFLAWHTPDEQLKFDNLPAVAGTVTAVG